MSRNLTTEALPPPNLSGVGELAMVTDIAKMYGVTRQAVDLWTREAGFPEPVDTVTAGRIWRTADIVKWAEARGREIHE